MPDAETPLLVGSNIRRTFGGLVAVDVDAISIQRDSITALIGPNGAGKTTLFNVLTGFDRYDEGSWQLDGVELAGKHAYAIARAGMVRTFQLTRVLDRLTVRENVALGVPGQPGERIRDALIRPRWRAREAEVLEQATATLERFGLTHMADEYAGTLSGGQRKLLEMARSMVAEPKLLLLDEPMAGVNPALVQHLLTHIRRLNEEGTTIAFVEHDMDVVMDISDRVICMAEGKVIAEGAPLDVASDPLVIDAYLGTHTADEHA